MYVGRCFQNGIYIMNLFDWYSAGFSLVIVAIFEIIAFSYIYGNDVTAVARFILLQVCTVQYRCVSDVVRGRHKTH